MLLNIKNLSSVNDINKMPCLRKVVKVGLGIDVEEIGRFVQKSTPQDTFLRKIFTEREIKFCFSKKNPAQHLAARFAGKEAVIKALCCVGFEPCPMGKIEILNDSKNVPRVKILNKTFQHLKVTVSLSHTSQISTAVALVIE